MKSDHLSYPGIACSSWVEGCMIQSDFFESAAAAYGNMVAFCAADVLHVMLPEMLQGGYPRDAFLSDLGNVQFVLAAFSESGTVGLSLSFEDGSDAPYQVSFERQHVRFVADHIPIRSGVTGWMQFHFGPHEFSRIIEYRMLVLELDSIPRPLPAPPKWNFDRNEISHASQIRLEHFVDNFFERCGNDCYDFEEFLSETYRRFKPEWKYLKNHLVTPWNAGAEKCGRGFLKVSEAQARKLVEQPRVDLTDLLNADDSL